jgi:hypothetical protein
VQLNHTLSGLEGLEQQQEQPTILLAQAEVLEVPQRLAR